MLDCKFRHRDDTEECSQEEQAQGTAWGQEKLRTHTGPREGSAAGTGACGRLADDTAETQAAPMLPNQAANVSSTKYGLLAQAVFLKSGNFI